MKCPIVFSYFTPNKLWLLTFHLHVESKQIFMYFVLKKVYHTLTVKSTAQDTTLLDGVMCKPVISPVWPENVLTGLLSAILTVSWCRELVEPKKMGAGGSFNCFKLVISQIITTKYFFNTLNATVVIIII